MLIMTIIFGINIIWAVMNWRDEYDLIMATFRDPTADIFAMLTSPVFFIADLAITGAATSIFGFAGFYGSAMAIFMSNVLSVVFFTPKGRRKDILKAYRQNKRDAPF